LSHLPWAGLPDYCPLMSEKVFAISEFPFAVSMITCTSGYFSSVAIDSVLEFDAFYGIDKAQLRAAKRGTANEERDMEIYLLRHFRGDPLLSMGKVFDIQSYSTVGSIIARFKVRMPSDRKLLRKVEEIRRVTMSQWDDLTSLDLDGYQGCHLMICSL
jgi:hypothetical protein